MVVKYRQIISGSSDIFPFHVFVSVLLLVHYTFVMALHVSLDPTRFDIEYCWFICIWYIILLWGLYQIFFSNQDDPVKDFIKVDMKRCSESPECRIYTVIDKKKENSTILCITVNDAQSCYALTCSCQKNRKKRAIKSPFVTYEPKEKPTLEEKEIPAQCDISIGNREYFPEDIHSTTARIAPFGFTSKNHSYDTKTLYKSKLNLKDTFIV